MYTERVLNARIELCVGTGNVFIQSLCARYGLDKLMFTVHVTFFAWLYRPKIARQSWR